MFLWVVCLLPLADWLACGGVIYNGFSCSLAAEYALVKIYSLKLSKPQEGKLLMLTLSIVTGIIDTSQNSLYAFGVLALMPKHFIVIKGIS